MKLTEKCCRTCTWWHIESVLTKNGKVRKDRSALCKYPVNEIQLPESVFTYMDTYGDTLRTTYMLPDKGQSCYFWTERVKKV